MRNRIIRKVGNSWYIKLEPTDIKDFNLNLHDLVDIEEASRYRRGSKICILKEETRRKRKKREIKVFPINQE